MSKNAKIFNEDGSPVVCLDCANDTFSLSQMGASLWFCDRCKMVYKIQKNGNTINIKKFVDVNINNTHAMQVLEPMDKDSLLEFLKSKQK
jgi:ribosomal protein L37AE/L43A